jgi:hypothetical protein
MQFSMSIGPRDPAPARSPDRPRVDGADRDAELRLLEAQLQRMRGMLFGYSSLFFATIRNWTFVCIGLLVLGWSGVLPAAVVPVPFLVPFAFLETGYLFWYTVFARRHAERLEQAINARLGADVLVAHRLEAAYFYPPDAPKIAGLSFGNALGFMSAMTVGYSVGAALVWLAGLVSTAVYVGDVMDSTSGPDILVSLVVPAAIAWTALIAAYLVWASLRRADENRLLVALDAAYPAPAAPVPAAAEPVPAPEPQPSADPAAAEPGTAEPAVAHAAAEPATAGLAAEPAATSAPAPGTEPALAPLEDR